MTGTFSVPKSTKWLKVYILGVSVGLYVRLQNSDFSGKIEIHTHQGETLFRKPRDYSLKF